jgi:DHA2 family multidrug resistance protein
MMTRPTVAALNSVHLHQAANASSFLNLIQQVGGSIGIAFLTFIINNRQVFHAGYFGELVDTSSASYQEMIFNLSTQARMLGYSHADSEQIATLTLAQNVQELAYMVSFNDAFFVCFLIALLGIIPALLLPDKMEQKGNSTTPVVSE